MPYRRRRNYRRRKVGTRRRFNNNRRYSRKRKNNMIASIAKVPGITLPDRMFVSMAFSFMSTFNFVASGALQAFAYSGNNINDPATTQSALRPSGWTQWSAFYDYFRCYASSITCKFMSSQDPTLPSAVRVAIVPVDNNFVSSATSINDWISQKYAKYRVYNATTQFPTIKHKMGCAKLNGVNREAVRENSSYTSLFTTVTGPQDGFSWYILAQPLASTTTTVNVQVRIIYNVELFQRKELLQP